MQIIISNQNKEPIYEQIANEIKSQIMTGKLFVGERLPSIRKLSRNLEISVITVKKAYDLLESQGMISTVPGKGSFVQGQNIEFVREYKLNEIQNEMISLISEAKSYGISKEALIEMLRLLYD